ncbi:MAG: cytochrome c [Crocinitomicaceae bacterium]
MLKQFLQFAAILLIAILLFAFQNITPGRYSVYEPGNRIEKEWLEKMSVSEVLIQLGEEKPLHHVATVHEDSASMGKQFVYFGKLKSDDKDVPRISKYFVCTDCHNQVLETDDPSDESPDRVLQYSMENDLPFLPASTFYGMYNMEHWYNGDYVKKYGDLVKPTRDTLTNAIQLCAIECSQGRAMKDWEIRCMLHYYKTIELKISDLKFSKDELLDLAATVGVNNKKAVKILKSKYNQINDAHFGTSEIPKIPDYEPNFEHGKFIYQNGCMYCHTPDKNMTNFKLSMNQLNFEFLARKIDKYNQYSIPHIVRYGTYAVVGRRQYMPMYTYENMSEEQLLDLIHFVKTKANE